MMLAAELAPIRKVLAGFLTWGLLRILATLHVDVGLAGIDSATIEGLITFAVMYMVPEKRVSGPARLLGILQSPAGQQLLAKITSGIPAGGVETKSTSKLQRPQFPPEAVEPLPPPPHTHSIYVNTPSGQFPACINSDHIAGTRRDCPHCRAYIIEGAPAPPAAGSDA